MAIGRSVSALAHAPRRGDGVWAMLCRATLRCIDWAAEACGVKDGPERVERSELLVEHAFLLPLPPSALGSPPRIDWARLGELDRAQVAAWTGHGPVMRFRSGRQ